MIISYAFESFNTSEVIIEIRLNFFKKPLLNIDNKVSNHCFIQFSNSTKSSIVHVYFVILKTRTSCMGFYVRRKNPCTIKNLKMLHVFFAERKNPYTLKNQKSCMGFYVRWKNPCTIECLNACVSSPDVKFHTQPYTWFCRHM